MSAAGQQPCRFLRALVWQNGGAHPTTTIQTEYASAAGDCI
jgi:hypothetical protein